MDKLKLSHLENVLKLPGSFDRNSMSSDACVLTCGCIVSEQYFSASIQNGIRNCPDCQAPQISYIKPVKQLRELYEIVMSLQNEQNVQRSRRRSSSKKSVKNFDQDHQQPRHTESMDLISLFYKYAKEETNPELSSSVLTHSSSISNAANVTNNVSSDFNTVTNAHLDTTSPFDLKSLPIDITPGPNGGGAGSGSGAGAGAGSGAGSGPSLGPSLGPNTGSTPGPMTPTNGFNSHSISPLNKYSPGTNNSILNDENVKNKHKNTKISKYEDFILSSLSEEKEFNFSKCFPFHRKLSTFQTQQAKFFLSNPFKGLVIKKGTRFICSSMDTYLDPFTGNEITRFVLITDKRWELYELLDDSDFRPNLICCGKLSGEYGSLFSTLSEDYGHEVIIRNDFGSVDASDSTSSNDDLRKKLNQWDQMYCKLSKDYLVISGTKGIMRVHNVSKTTLPHEMGKPIYTFITNFPIRCIAVSGTDPLIACGITAKERVSGKEQPFIILHKLNRANLGSKIIGSVEPITITIPYRDPIKIINFNANSTHIVCCTVWEQRYLIIRLRSPGSENYRKPRLIWTDAKALRNSKRKKSDIVFYDDSDNDDSDDDALMMDREGITDVQFGNLPNTVVLSSCSLQNKPPIMIRLEGSGIDSGQFNRNMSDAVSHDLSLYSKPEIEDELGITVVKSSDILIRFLEVGFAIHQIALSPRRDALAFLDKDGRVYIVSIPNYELNVNTSVKKVVVLLGEVSNAERYSESASVTFSADGGKVYVVDRKGLFLVFDFTKGVPGQDSDVVKCKIINV